MMDRNQDKAADTQAEAAAERPHPSAPAKPVDTAAQEQAGQDRAEGGGYG